MTWPGWKSSR